jgi:NAD(P)-dependent dehydrogenase (short-subunit alcohol dehydrogenase family)
MTDTLTGKVAIVTGAGRGIGAGVAKLLAAEGAAVVVNDLGVDLDGSSATQQHAAGTVDAIVGASGRAVASYADVTSFDSGAGLVQQAIDAFGGLDIVVTCHGILRDRMIFNMTDEEWDAVIAVHLTGTFNVLRHAAGHMRQQKSGRIITFSSTTGLVGNPGQANYGAAKSGIGGLTKVVARDLGRYGVTCNSIVPVAATRMTTSVSDEARAKRNERGIARSAEGASGVAFDPDDIAPMVGYLASDFASTVNGQFFYVYGKSISVMSQPRLERTIVKTEGFHSVDELRTLFPERVTGVLVNPAPARPIRGGKNG